MLDWDETHVGSYSKKEVVKMVKNSGFQILQTKRISNPFPIVMRFSKRLSNYLERFTFGFFGDFLTIIAKNSR